MTWTIEVDYIVDWLDGLDDKTAALVSVALDLLAEEGPALKRPLVGEISGSRIRNLKELRPGSSGLTEVRILFAFDPRRHAVMLFAGDKRNRWRRWYDEAIKVAEQRYDEHLKNVAEQGR